MSIARDPYSILRYRELLEQTGVLDRPVECLSDEEVVETVERIIASFGRIQREIEAGTQRIIRALKATSARLAAFGEALTAALANELVAEAERITAEAER